MLPTTYLPTYLLPTYLHVTTTYLSSAQPGQSNPIQSNPIQSNPILPGLPNYLVKADKATTSLITINTYLTYLNYSSHELETQQILPPAPVHNALIRPIPTDQLTMATDSEIAPKFAPFIGMVSLPPCPPACLPVEQPASWGRIVWYMVSNKARDRI